MSQDTELIKERLDLAEVVGEYVQLKRNGRNFKGLCPFHQEKTPSFIVSPDKGIWHCFGCQSGGDVFSFIQEVEKIDFPTALKMLADRAGVEIKQGQAPQHDRRVRQFELLGMAARFYHELLTNQSVGKKSLIYLKDRGVQKKTIKEFEIGYAPQRWDSLQQFLQAREFSDREMIESGLVGKSERGKLYDRFRGRIMFPIYDLQGRVVAFGGRIVPWHVTGNEGKYINSPETNIYRKRQVVYNLQRAKKSLAHQPCIVVEGYMDVVMLVQAGVDNVVASSGTAFTSEQVQQIKRYTDTLHFAFDADSAGMNAAEHATQEAMTAGMRVGCLLFPEGTDPADMVRDNLSNVKSFLEKTMSITELMLQRLKQAGQEDREKVLERILPFVQQVSNLVYQGEMIVQIAEILHIPESLVVDRLASLKRQPTLRQSEDDEENDLGIQLGPEHLLLGVLLVERQGRQKWWDKLKADLFVDHEAETFFDWWVNEAVKDEVILEGGADEIISRVPEELLSYAEGVRGMAEEHLAYAGVEAVRELKSLMVTVQVLYLKRQLKELQQQLDDPDLTDRQAALQNFRKTLVELSAVERVDS